MSKVLIRIMDYILFNALLVVIILIEKYFIYDPHSIPQGLVIFMSIIFIFISSLSWLYYLRKKARDETSKDALPKYIRNMFIGIILILLTIMLVELIYAGAMVIKYQYIL